PCVPPEQYRARSGIGTRADSILIIVDNNGQVEHELAGSSRAALLIGSSDSGAQASSPEHGPLADRLPNGELRAQKPDVYDGGHRAPLIVSGDGLAPCVDERLVSLLDLFPSLCAHVQRKTEDRRTTGPATARGRSVLDGAPDLLSPSAPS